MSCNGPNKTVAAARKRMGGFPPKPANPARDPRRDPFMAWVFDQARAGASFANEAEARAAFEAAGSPAPKVEG